MWKLLLSGLFTICAMQQTCAKSPIKSFEILDGDTISVTHNNLETSIFRLSYIDAPEAAQASGYRSARNLNKLLNTSPDKIKYRVDFVDAFARKNVTITINNKNINALQVKDGYAWVAHRNAPVEFHNAEYTARKFGKGLWSESDPTPPWIFRSQIK